MYLTRWHLTSSHSSTFLYLSGSLPLMSYLSNPFLDEPKGAASALHSVLSFPQSHSPLPKVPNHITNLAFHSLGSASEERGRGASEQQMSKYDLSSHQSWRTLLLGRQ